MAALNAMPMVVVNLGGEMLYILEQRLQAQAELLLFDIVASFFFVVSELSFVLTGCLSLSVCLSLSSLFLCLRHRTSPTKKANEVCTSCVPKLSPARL